MTEIQLRNSVASWLTKYLGCAEGSAKHHDILSVFNNSGLCSRYRMTVNDAWCATAVSAAFIACGLAGKPGSGSLFECVDCGCDRVIAMAKAQGIWTESDSYTPKVGDCILYAWSDSGYGDCTLSTDHIGIVCSVSGSSFKVIEGNISNTVGYRNMSVNGRYIRGYVTPNYAKFASGESKADTYPSKPNGYAPYYTYTSHYDGNPVYADSAMTIQIGSLGEGEYCHCMQGTAGTTVVWYKLDNGNGYKIGYVNRSSGDVT